VFDTVYNPEQTLLIKQAREAQCTVITGVDMFVGQAGLQYKLFTGQDASPELMRQVMRRAISAVKY
jgi:3-dehydroquinate dehydratase/shikimate dehydrogenase